LAGINTDQRRLLRKLDAKWVKTVANERGWADWYAVPLDGFRLDEIVTRLRQNGIQIELGSQEKGVYLDLGWRVALNGVGNGAESVRGRAGRARRALIRQLEQGERKSELWARLLRTLFGSRQFELPEGLASFPKGWDAPKHLWNKLRRDYPDLGKVWNYVEYALFLAKQGREVEHRHANVEWSRKQRILRKWVVGLLRKLPVYREREGQRTKTIRTKEKEYHVACGLMPRGEMVRKDEVTYANELNRYTVLPVREPTGVYGMPVGCDGEGI
jgi:hypothetical protein